MAAAKDPGGAFCSTAEASIIWLYQTRPTDWAPNYFAGCTCGFMQRQIGMGLDVPFMDEAEAAGQLINGGGHGFEREKLPVPFLHGSSRIRCGNRVARMPPTP